MGEPFKNLIGPAQVDWLASQLSAAWAAFPADEFRRKAKAGLTSLELTRSLELQHRSIRRLFTGVHEVELQVNGTRSPMGSFKLEV